MTEKFPKKGKSKRLGKICKRPSLIPDSQEFLYLLSRIPEAPRFLHRPPRRTRRGARRPSSCAAAPRPQNRASPRTKPPPSAPPASGGGVPQQRTEWSTTVWRRGGSLVVCLPSVLCVLGDECVRARRSRGGGSRTRRRPQMRGCSRGAGGATLVSLTPGCALAPHWCLPQFCWRSALGVRGRRLCVRVRWCARCACVSRVPRTGAARGKLWRCVCVGGPAV